jgi:dTDP-4-dehydrorhamnose reductase
MSQGRTKPTWAKHLAEYMVQCVTLNVPSGLYHVADAMESSWSDWARTVLSAAFTPEQYSVRPLEEHEENNPQRACRPLYSVLDCSVIENHGIAMKSISSEELESLTRIWLKEGRTLLHQHS